MAKDRLRSLFNIISTGDAGKIRQEANRILTEIQEDQATLSKDQKLVKDLLVRYGGPEDGLTPSERSAKVREAALALVHGGKSDLTGQDVLDYLQENENLTFDVERPGSLVGTVLSQMKEFERMERNQFRYRNGTSEEQS
ncbi:MAG TPA: hypothetical protein VIP09_04745 [Dehalococcoidia bacterium]